MRTRRLGLILATLAFGSACSKDSSTGPRDRSVLELGASIAISGAEGSENFYTVVVPAGSPALRVTLVGDNGDADLYLRFGSAPTPDAWDCESAFAESNEECLILNPEAGTWHVAVVGFEAYSAVALKAEITAGLTSTALTSGTPLPGQAGAEGSKRYFRITVPNAATSLTVTTSGGTGDLDLFVRFNGVPSEFNHDCVSGSFDNAESCSIASPAPGVWYILLDGFSAYSGATLTATVN